MRIHAIALAAALASVMAGPAVPDKAPMTPEEIAARESALDNLLSERESVEAFKATIDAARKAGVSEQAILEARFLFRVDRREDEAIAAMLPDFLKQQENFKLEDSAIFAVKEDWLAVIEYVKAISSLQSGDKDAFKKHITEAFWLGPRQAAAFAPHIERLRLEEAMRSVTVDFTMALAPQDGGAPVTLKSLMDGRKALLLQFWTPRSRECEASMPDFSRTAGMLSSNGIAVASLLPSDSPEILTAANAMALPYKGKPCGAWLVDSGETSLGRDLRVQNLPTMVIVSAEGRVLFNGDPTDEQFWDALKKIDARITRPPSEGDYEQ